MIKWLLLFTLQMEKRSLCVRITLLECAIIRIQINTVAHIEISVALTYVFGSVLSMFSCNQVTVFFFILDLVAFGLARIHFFNKFFVRSRYWTFGGKIPILLWNSSAYRKNSLPKAARNKDKVSVCSSKTKISAKK